VVVAVDDVDRADASTKLLLEELFVLADSLPLMLILALRPEPGTPGWDARVSALADHSHRTFELRLPPLRDEEGDEVIALMDGDSVLTPAIGCELRARAEGNPFYLEELTQTAIEAIRAAPTDFDDATLQLRLPAALEGLLLARVDRVSPRARRVLQAAAVLGRRFPEWVLQAICGPSGVSQYLEQLVRSGVIHEDGLTPSPYYAFRHGLYQEAVLTTLTKRRTGELHEAVAEALESGPSSEQVLEKIASHYLASGNKKRALEYLERAGRRAASLSSLPEAVDLIGQAIDLSESVGDHQASVRIATLAAELARQSGSYEEASRLWRELLNKATDDEQRAHYFLEVARTEFELGNGEAAAQACEEGLKLRGSDSIRGDLLLLMAGIMLRQDRLERMKDLLTDVDSLKAGLPRRVEAQRMSLWAGYHTASGELETAERCAEQTVEVAREEEDPALILRAKRDLGIIQFVNGRLESAQALLQDVYTSALESGHSVRAQEAVATLVGVHLLLGNLERALRMGLEAIAWIHAPFWRAAVLVNLGEVEYEMGIRGAREHLLECVAICEGEQESKAIGGIATLRLAGISLDEGDLQAATAASSAVAKSDSGNGRTDLQVQTSLSLATIALAREDLHLALECVERAFELSRRADKTERPAVLRLLGQVQFLLGRPEGIRTLEVGVETSSAMSMRLEEARTMTALGVAAGKANSSYFHRARELLAACGCERGLAELRQAVVSARSA
jgi:tetratricopeptide (TPR) repeat protein